jgi:hypothetical protein
MKQLAHSPIAALIVSGAACAYGQGGDAKTSLQQTLNSQYTVTKVSADRNDIVTPGTVLVFQKDGLIMYSTASPMPPLSTWKNGKMSKSFAQDLAIGLASKNGATVDSYPRRTFVAGEKAWFAGFNFQKDGVVLLLYSDPYSDIRYYTLLKFPFDKKSPPSTEEAQAKIAEVVTVQPPDDSQAPAPAADPVPPGALQNDDILKIVKAGLDDSIIIAKIKTSKCQFDTAPDTLIALKQSGVSSAVMRAMTQAPHE